MLDAVSTSQIRSADLRAVSQAVVAVSASAPAESFNKDFVASRIRMDNLQNIAILEYRSSEGEVVRQYPTETQIKAFKRAQQLHVPRAQETSPVPQQQSAASAPAETVSHAAPAPETAAPAPAAGGEDSAHHSVVV